MTFKLTGLRSRIDAKCRECVYDPLDKGTWRKQVENCTSPNCPLFDVRPLPIKKKSKSRERKC